jgi:hypothetical protein
MISLAPSVRRTLLILLPIVAVAAAILYICFDPATATLFLFAGIVLSASAASTTLLGAYTRNKDIARQRERDAAETIDPKP